MNTLVVEPLAKVVTFDLNNMWVELADGRKLGIPLAYFPRLRNATTEQREKYEISGGGTGLHWDELNEDISVKALLMGVGDRTLPSSKSATRKTLTDPYNANLSITMVRPPIRRSIRLPILPRCERQPMSWNRNLHHLNIWKCRIKQFSIFINTVC